MKLNILFTIGLFTVLSCNSSQKNDLPIQETTTIETKESPLKLGAFSLSINVKDLKASKAFYEKLDFVVLGGSLEENYLIMKNGTTLIGLFYEMFEGHILTFNPGWDENGENLDDFDDIRTIQAHLKSKGLTISDEIPTDSVGPAYLSITDPDGNLIIFDQHR